MKALKLAVSVVALASLTALAQVPPNPGPPGGPASRDAIGRPTSQSGESGVQVIGLSVAQADAGAKLGVPSASGLPGGTWAYLRIEQKDSVICGIDAGGLSITTFADNAGTNLLEPIEGSLSWGFDVHMTDDAHACVLVVGSKHLPADKATSLKIAGKATLVCGSDEKTSEQRDTLLRKDTKLFAGPLMLNIAAITPTPNGQTLSVMSETDLASIRQLVLVAGGKDYPARKVGTSRVRIGGANMYVLDLTLDTKLDLGTVKIIYCAKTERVTVPVSADVSLSLNNKAGG